MSAARHVAATADPVAAVLDAHDRGEPIALRTSGTTSEPRAVVRTTRSWVDSFPHVSELTGIDARELLAAALGDAARRLLGRAKVACGRLQR